MGFKEFKTAKKVQDMLDELGIEHQDGVAITGVIAPLKGRSSKVRLALMGELDAIVAPGHRCADPVTGAAHSCGHHVQIATIMGAAMALKESGIMSELDGDIVLMGVPAEEGVELEYRHGLIKEGKLSFIGGKQEFIKLGVFDDIDMMLMQHTDGSDKVAAGGPVGMGYVAKLVYYKGKEAHAGGAPWDGVNALQAAKIGLMAIDAQRETFRDKDNVRVHPIITKGGDLVNVVPADVRIETFCRANNMEAIEDASMKVNRALKAGADAVGAEVEIVDIPGYMTPYECLEMKAIVEDNLALIYGKENVVPGVGYTTEANGCGPPDPGGALHHRRRGRHCPQLPLRDPGQRFRLHQGHQDAAVLGHRSAGQRRRKGPVCEKELQSSYDQGRISPHMGPSGCLI